MATGTFADFIGQTALKEKIRSTMRLALSSGDPLPHILLSGSPEMGKVTFARALERWE
jgi:Holliday junction resolvasome RuvABC ATP-dependent DNA helicase subunit